MSSYSIKKQKETLKKTMGLFLRNKICWLYFFDVNNYICNILYFYYNYKENLLKIDKEMNNLNLKLKLKKQNEEIKKIDERIKTENIPTFSSKQQKQGSINKKLTKIKLVSKILKTQNNELRKQINEDNRKQQPKNFLKIIASDKKSFSNTMKIKLKSIKTQYYEEKVHPVMINSKKYHKDFNQTNIKRESLSFNKYDKSKIDWSLSKESKINNLEKAKNSLIKDVQKDMKEVKINQIKESSPFKLNIKRELIGQQRYAFEQQAGSGTFGIVHKARDRKNMQLVAIKKVFQDKNYKNRELDIMKILNHPNIIKMKDFYFSYSKDKEYLNIVMDYYPINLSEYIYNQKKSKDERFWLQFKVLAFFMLKALLYLDIHKIAHRDLKPHNILLNPSKCSLIICDFGSAKIINPSQTNLAYICSRSYRAPELILGNNRYGTFVDMWSIGCILVEMIVGQTLFKAKSNIDQLMEIIKLLGSPTIDQIRDMNPQCQAEKFKFPKLRGNNLQKLLQAFIHDAQLLDLLKKMLRYSPKTRLSPLDGLKHNYFKAFKEQQSYKRILSQIRMQNLLNFDWLDNFSLKATLIPKWYNN